MATKNSSEVRRISTLGVFGLLMGTSPFLVVSEMHPHDNSPGGHGARKGSVKRARATDRGSFFLYYRVYRVYIQTFRIEKLCYIPCIPCSRCPLGPLSGLGALFDVSHACSTPERKPQAIRPSITGKIGNRMGM